MAVPPPPEAPKLPTRLIENATVLTDRETLLTHLPKHRRFAEVGVGLGLFTRQILAECEPSLFLALDNFQLHTETLLWGEKPEIVLGNRTHEAFYRDMFAHEIASGRMQLSEGDSAACLERLEDASVDIIYIDAGHLYHDVIRDLAVARRKVAEDGWIIVNDYIMVPQLHADEHYGVVPATNQFMIAHDWGMQFFALQTSMFCDVALRPMRFFEARRREEEKQQWESQRLAEDLATIRGSTSWRATAPLRAGFGAIQRLFG